MLGEPIASIPLSDMSGNDKAGVICAKLTYETGLFSEENQDEYQDEYQGTTDEYFLKAISVFSLKLDYTEVELKKGYKEIMKTYHPDKYQNEKPEIKKLVEEKAKETNEFYEYLLNRLNAKI